MKRALVLGAGGFIGSHMASRLKSEGYHVIGVDLKLPEFSKTSADIFIIGDLRDPLFVSRVFDDFDLVVQFAADMGGAEYIFTGENDANVMHNSALINLNVANEAIKHKTGCLLYSSSACIYPQQIQEDPNNIGLKEDQAYPANPDSEYGYEKLFSERLYDAYRRNYGLNIRIVRFHNVFGEEGTWQGNKAKAPAALCRKVCETEDSGFVDVLGDGKQTRSFIYIDEAIEGCIRLINSNYYYPVNIGSNEIISIGAFIRMILDISGKHHIKVRNFNSNAVGVRGRNSDNSLIFEKLGWKPTQPLRDGMEKLYSWINQQVNGRN